MQVQERVDLVLELVPGPPISGRLVDGSVQSEFVGWTQLVANLRRAMDERTPASTVKEDD
jgi:hypothetical protein